MLPFSSGIDSFSFLISPFFRRFLLGTGNLQIPETTGGIMVTIVRSTMVTGTETGTSTLSHDFLVVLKVGTKLISQTQGLIGQPQVTANLIDHGIHSSMNLSPHITPKTVLLAPQTPLTMVLPIWHMACIQCQS